MSEYGWPRPYVIWGLSFETGIKHINSIASRYAGKNLLEEKFRDQFYEKLAEFMANFNKEHGLDGTGNTNRRYETQEH